MSICNLNSFVVQIDNLQTKDIDTPNLGDVLNIGTVNAAPINIGKIASEVLFGGRIRSAFIDTNAAVNPTLFIGADPSTLNIQLGHAGVPITASAGVIAPSITRGGSVGPGVLAIGDNLANTAIGIGNTSAPMLLFANSLQFPGTASPLVITETRAGQDITVGFTGAVITAIGAKASYYRFGNFVTIQVKNLFTRAAPTADCVNGAVPILMSGVLAVDYRPANLVSFACGAYRNGVNVSGLCNIFPNGDISVGSLDTGVFTVAQTCGIMDFSYSFHVNN